MNPQLQARLERFQMLTVRAVRRAGWAGAVGLGLLAFALAFSLSVDQLQSKHEAELVAERAMLLKVAAAPAGAQTSDRARLAGFYARFAPASELSGVLAGIHLAADRHGLLPERADYRSALVSGTPLVRITATLPMQGRFEALYAWLGEIVRDHPGVAIDQLSLQREREQDARIDADVRLSVLVRGGE